MIDGEPYFRVQSKTGFTTKNQKKHDVQINQELVDLLTAQKDGQRLVSGFSRTATDALILAN